MPSGPPPSEASSSTSRKRSLESDGSTPQINAASSIPKHWDTIVHAFLQRAGLHEALRGFERDMLVMSSEWENTQIPLAITSFMRDILQLEDNPPAPATPLDNRKLQYVFTNSEKPLKSPSALNKEISRFMARSRARNNTSNRLEFTKPEALQKLIDARRSGGEPPTTCARTDARLLDRDVQMRYDIARNEDGPLRRTVHDEVKDEVSGSGKEEEEEAARLERDPPTIAKHPGLEERFKNIEQHLAVHYVPSPPRSLLDRLRYLEDHLISLEKEHPPWAALHFAQPRRGWPPPPRSTPLIVPPHLASYDDEVNPDSNGGYDDRPKKKVSTSLHRAVVERLEIQRAKEDLQRRHAPES